MANAKKAIPTVEVMLAGKPYKMKFGMKAIIALDRAFGINLLDQGEASKLEMTPLVLTKLLWSGLQRYHRDLTPEDVEDLLDDSDQDEIESTIKDAFAHAMEDEVKKNQQSEDKEEKAKKAKS